VEPSPIPAQFNEFWELYLQEHQSRLNQWLHAFGTGLSLTLMSYCVITQNYYRFILVPILGYGFAWIGQMFIEKNRPLTLKAPLWSLLCDYRLFALIILGQSSAIRRPILKD